MANLESKSLSYKVHYSAPLLFVGVLFNFTLLSGLLLSAPKASAETVTLNVNIDAVCSLTIDKTAHSATINPGSSGTIGTSTIKSVCNDPGGLAVYATGYTDNSYGNNNLTSTAGNTTYNIPSATDQAPGSQWNMTLAAVSGAYIPNIVTGFDSAHAVPDEYTKVAYRNSMTDIGSGATGANFTATFNATVSATQAAGAYHGKVKFLLVHPNVLTWQEDSQNPGTMIPDEVQPNTLRYDPEQPVTFDMAYAAAGKTKQGDYYKLQDMTNTICSDVTTGQEGTVIDTRDGQTYTINKFKMNVDGSKSACWMSNLNLGAQSLTVAQLDNTNTHLPNDDTKFITSSDFMDWNRTISGNTTSNTDPKFTPISAANSVTGSDTDSYGNKYGTLYNYAAATAKTYAHNADYTYSELVEWDICPAGWRLPMGAEDFSQSDREFKQLINDGYSITSSDSLETIQSDLGFSLAGGFSGSAPDSQGVVGRYWAAKRMTASLSYADVLGFGGAMGISTTDWAYRFNGNSIRCIAQ